MEKLLNLRHLDISGTNIRELPRQISELENLQTLTVFLVGKGEVGLSVRELGRFPNLQGKLAIKNLHNVVDANEMNGANLKSKQDIEELELEWGEQVEDSRMVKDVCDMLKPSINLKKLSINLYSGTSFPAWLGDSCFANMVYLCLNNCENCFSLPPLGQLPSLKHLDINGMTMLETVGPEFYGIMDGAYSSSSFQPFPSLQKLKFDNMPNWKEWLPFGGDKTPFPCLETLYLYLCPKLKGDFPIHHSPIKHVGIHGGYTEKTQQSLNGNDTSIPKMIIASMACLHELTLTSIPCLTAFPADGLPTSLRSILISDCGNLEFLHPETWSNYTSLVSLALWESCDSLTSFPLDGFPKLQILEIIGCRNLESIYFISETSSFSSLILHTFFLESCEALRSMPHRMDTLTTLENLYLYDLPQLELSFCEPACLPPKLGAIYIVLVRIIRPPVTEWTFQGLASLTEMRIGGDDIVKTLLINERLLLPTSLVTLRITRLSKMQCLEGNGLRRLSSLRDLEIYNCLRLESLPEDSFPSSLETLEFRYCPSLESFPEDSLPSSLKILCITGCPLLEARYGSESGKHWSNIAHIPVIRISDQVTL